MLWCALDLRPGAGQCPEPVIESTEFLDGQPRITYRLDPGELDHLRTALRDAGLSEAILVPRRSRVHVEH